MDINSMKKVLNQKEIDPLLIVVAHKGYEWIISDKLTEEDAAKFEQYILNNTTSEEIKELRSKKKSLRDFLIWKYINQLDKAFFR